MSTAFKDELLLELLNNSNDMVFVLNLSTMGFIEYANKTAIDTLGYTFEEIQELGVEGFRKSLPEAESFNEHIQELKSKDEGMTDYAILVKKTRQKYI